MELPSDIGGSGYRGLEVAWRDNERVFYTGWSDRRLATSITSHMNSG
jgi:hypothetical protein